MLYEAIATTLQDNYILYCNGKQIGVLIVTAQEINKIVFMLNNHPLNDE